MEGISQTEKNSNESIHYCHHIDNSAGKKRGLLKATKNRRGRIFRYLIPDGSFLTNIIECRIERKEEFGSYQEIMIREGT